MSGDTIHARPDVNLPAAALIPHNYILQKYKQQGIKEFEKKQETKSNEEEQDEEDEEDEEEQDEDEEGSENEVGTAVKVFLQDVLSQPSIEGRREDTTRFIQATEAKSTGPGYILSHIKKKCLLSCAHAGRQ